jgi:DNA modification methylase
MYVEHMVEVCREVKRVLKKTGSMYIVLGDTYAGSHCGSRDYREKYGLNKPERYDKPSPQAEATGYQPKCLMGIPWRVAFALIEDGWILRNDIIWYKPNHMPSSVKDRLTQTYEHIFHFVKSRKYYYNLDNIREPHKTESIERWDRALRQKVDSNAKLRRKMLETTGVTVASMVPKWFEYTKHDLAVGRVGGFSYTDPLHEKAYNVKGKNPGDTWKWSEDTKEKAWYYNLGKIRQKMRELGLPEQNPKGRNPGDHWSISTKPFKGAHFAVYPVSICVRPILSSAPPDGVVLDPMCGSGTTCLAAQLINLKRWDLLGYEPNETAKSIDWRLKWIGIDINRSYVELARDRLKPYLVEARRLEEFSK